MTFTSPLPVTTRSTCSAQRRQRRAHLLGERVPLIHADHAGETAALVIQNLFDDMQRDATPREARGDAAAKS